MTRVSHLGIGIGLCLFCFVCLTGGYWMFCASAIAKDSVPGGRLFDGGTIILFILFGAPGLGALWLAFRSFRRAFQPPATQTRTPTPAPEQGPGIASTGTADERLAHLVKTPNDKP